MKYIKEFIFSLCISMQPYLVKAQVLDVANYKHYITTFNSCYTEKIINAIDNEHCWEWMTENIPFFDCPDKQLEEVYYYRWYVYRKHIKKTPAGYVVTEFLPDVSWAGKYNTISATASHHLYEGRWLRNHEFMDQYARFWFTGGGTPRSYTGWLANAIYNYYLVSDNKQLVVSLLPHLIVNYQAWEEQNRDSTGLFWQTDVRDGGEESIGGNGYRPNINSFMIADAIAIAKIALLAGKPDVAIHFQNKADILKQLMLAKLWDPSMHFFKVLPKEQAASVVRVKEELGYIPWYFNIPPAKYSTAWKYLMDSKYFYAPFGPTTAERNHPRFMYEHRRFCMWNGYSWPFATSQTLTALINLLHNYRQNYVDNTDFFKLLEIYTRSQHIKSANGVNVPWIDESLDPLTGEWFTKRELAARNAPDKNRGEHYNHSTYNDLIISGLVGLQPSANSQLVIYPLLPRGKWKYFCLDYLSYKNTNLTILYDVDGTRYHKGKGFMVINNGKLIARATILKRLTVNL